MSAISATPAKTFFGIQPRTEQVPPNGPSLITATFFPTFFAAIATWNPAPPDPSTRFHTISSCLIALSIDFAMGINNIVVCSVYEQRVLK